MLRLLASITLFIFIAGCGITDSSVKNEALQEYFQQNYSPPSGFQVQDIKYDLKVSKKDGDYYELGGYVDVYGELQIDIPEYSMRSGDKLAFKYDVSVAFTKLNGKGDKFSYNWKYCGIEKVGLKKL